MSKSQTAASPRLRQLRNYLRRSNAERARQELPIIPEFEEMWMKIDAGGDLQALVAEAEALIIRHGAESKAVRGRA